VGFGLAISALGVVVGPPTFGWVAARFGGYRVAWMSLAGSMALSLALLSFVREDRRRYDR